MIANYMKRFFSHYLPIQKGLSINTIWAYRDAIKLLLCYAADTLRKSADELNVEEIEESLVLAFLDHLENARGCTPRTRNARLAAIRVFFGLKQPNSSRALRARRSGHWPLLHLPTL